MRAVAVGVCAAVALVAASVALARGSGPSALPAWSCAKPFFKSRGEPDLLIASDLPRQGPTKAETASISKAIQFVLQRHGFKAGGRSVAYQACDSSTADARTTEPAKCAANAASYAVERRLAGVIGTLDAVCTSLELPILNRAERGRVPLVAFADTYPGLTRAVEGLTAPGEPGLFHPTGRRSFVRVVGTDDLQPPALAALIRRIGKQSVYVLDDGSDEGAWAAASFRRAAEAIGIDVRGAGGWEAGASGYEGLAKRIEKTGAEAVFLSGSVASNGGKLVADLRRVLGEDAVLVAGRGFAPATAVVAAAGPAAEGLYLSLVGPPLERLGSTGRRFLREFAVYQKSEDVGRHALYAAQAADLLLDAVARSNGTPASVAAGLLGARVGNGILGSFRIEPSGDTSLRTVSVYRVERGRAVFDRVVTPPRP